MIYRASPINNAKSYKPSGELVQYLKERLQFETRRMRKRNAASDFHRGEDNAQDKKEENRMSRRKNYFLNKYVFSSMANLVVFLEYASRNELRKVFDKDLKELFLSESEHEPDDYRKPIFRRLVHAALAERNEDEERDFFREGFKKMKSGDFKFLLAEMVQRELMWMILGATESRFGSDTVVKDLVKPDIGRAVTWLTLLAETVTPESKKFNSTNRPVLF
jgi:hypothetical protein